MHYFISHGKSSQYEWITLITQFDLNLTNVEHSKHIKAKNKYHISQKLNTQSNSTSSESSNSTKYKYQLHKNQSITGILIVQ
jgi:hypothetical protein